MRSGIRSTKPLAVDVPALPRELAGARQEGVRSPQKETSSYAVRLLSALFRRPRDVGTAARTPGSRTRGRRPVSPRRTCGRAAYRAGRLRPRRRCHARLGRSPADRPRRPGTRSHRVLADQTWPLAWKPTLAASSHGKPHSRKMRTLRETLPLASWNSGLRLVRSLRDGLWPRLFPVPHGRTVWRNRYIRWSRTSSASNADACGSGPVELWRVYLTDDDPPKPVTYCPDCAEHEFG